MKKRILSGINPSSQKGLHIGNYFGAVERFVHLQDEGECFFFVANLHALNTVFNPNEAQSNAHNVFLEYLALGIDPEKSVFYLESDIPYIPYLQTILNNVVTVAELQRMHGFKDKLAKDATIEQISAGLFSYPVLMAADILLFAANVVPVGEDQAQHVEVCREIARTFNNRYGNVLTVPELAVHEKTARIIGTDGVRKMSKTLGNDISIFADEPMIFKQIMGITTDPARIHPTDPGDPAKNICFSYLRLFKHPEHEVRDLEERYRRGAVGDVEIKKRVFEAFMSVFAPFRNRKSELQRDAAELDRIYKQGREKALHVAQQQYEIVRQAVGLDIRMK
jgi:tryptophanyl-tRNA synthetase